MLSVKRVYEAPGAKDGFRILVDRLWPRGLRKQRARIDLWLREVAPSNELRKWFAHEPQKWAEFQKRYAEELRAKEELLSRIRDAVEEHGTVTLLFAASDTKRNNAVALREHLRKAVASRLSIDQPTDSNSCALVVSEREKV